MDLIIITLFVGFAHHTLTEKWKVPHLDCFWCFSFWASLFLFTANMNPLNNIPEFMITCIIKAGACTYLGSLINLWRSNQ